MAARRARSAGRSPAPGPVARTRPAPPIPASGREAAGARPWARSGGRFVRSIVAVVRGLGDRALRGVLAAVAAAAAAALRRRRGAELVAVATTMPTCHEIPPLGSFA